MNSSILVPHDFTEVGDFALEHAYLIGKLTGAPINMLHVIKRKKYYDECLAKLEEIAKKFSESKDIEINVKVIKGDLYKTIYQYGIDTEASIAVMGTHGVKSVKKAMKVVKKFTRVPFILVQDNPVYGEYDKVIIPIDSDIKSRAKFHWLKYLSALFKCEAFIITYEEKDKYKAKTLNSNIRFAEKLLDHELIDYKIKKIENKKKYTSEVYEYSNEVQGSLVLIMSARYRKFAKQIKRTANLEYFKKVPIMCVNPRTDIVKAGSFS